MEMDIYELDAYRASVSNFIMLKILHDNGIDVTCYPNFTVYSNDYGSEGSWDILTTGLEALFCDYELYDYNEIQSSSYSSFKNAENLIIIKDSIFADVIQGPYCEEFKEYIKNLTTNECEIEGSILDCKSGVIYSLSYPGYLHEILLCILDSYEYAKSLKANK